MYTLVTGASGQLGAYLLRELTAAGADVTAWSGSRRGELFGVPFQPVDLADTDVVTLAFQQARPDLVIHTAAVSSVAECYRDPARAGRAPPFFLAPPAAHFRTDSRPTSGGVP